MQMTDVDIQNCIDKCTQTAQNIRTIANDVVDHRARYALAEANRHAELCIHSCLDAKAITKVMSQQQGMGQQQQGMSQQGMGQQQGMNRS